MELWSELGVQAVNGESFGDPFKALVSVQPAKMVSVIESFFGDTRFLWINIKPVSVSRKILAVPGCGVFARMSRGRMLKARSKRSGSTKPRGVATYYRGPEPFFQMA